MAGPACAGAAFGYGIVISLLQAGHLSFLPACELSRLNCLPQLGQLKLIMMCPFITFHLLY
jgi:hypothetical protein